MNRVDVLLPPDLLAAIDEAGKQIGERTGRRVSRSAIARVALAHELVNLAGADVVAEEVATRHWFEWPNVDVALLGLEK